MSDLEFLLYISLQIPHNEFVGRDALSDVEIFSKMERMGMSLVIPECPKYLDRDVTWLITIFHIPPLTTRVRKLVATAKITRCNPTLTVRCDAIIGADRLLLILPSQI